jgi:hypothetical protein
MKFSPGEKGSTTSQDLQPTAPHHTTPRLIEPERSALMTQRIIIPEVGCAVDGLQNGLSGRCEPLAERRNGTANGQSVLRAVNGFRVH